MADTPKDLEQTNIKKAGRMAGVTFIILLSIVFLAYQYSKPRIGTVVLPGGITYLGPSPTTQDQRSKINNQKESQNEVDALAEQSRFTAESDVAWSTVKSKKYGYTFSVPETLTLEPFLTDEFDAYAITWNNVPKEANVLIGVEDLASDEKKMAYVQKSKKEYVESFWSKQYNLTGVKTIETFTNSKRLKGYKVKFQTNEGVSPFDDVFFEVPNKPNLLFHLSHAILDPAVFEKIVDSVDWTST